MEIITESAQQTQQMGYDLAQQLENGVVVALYGDLGSGKTTFTQGLAKGFGISNRILSPTFVIVRSYKTAQIKGSLYHLDLYRLQEPKEVKDLGIEDIIKSGKNIVVIEWPEKIEELLPQKRINITFEYIGDNKRKIIIKNNE